MESRYISLSAILRKQPNARAQINGDSKHKDIRGAVGFYATPYGIMVVTSISGLPVSEEKCKRGIFAYHIHQGSACTGNESDPFASTLSHYNPANCPHPYHSGDLPPLFSANGYAFSAFLTSDLTIDEIIGKTIVIHDSLDDFTTQPSGNSGNKIACGEII